MASSVSRRSGIFAFAASEDLSEFAVNGLLCTKITSADSRSSLRFRLPRGLSGLGISGREVSWDASAMSKGVNASLSFRRLHKRVSSD